MNLVHKLVVELILALVNKGYEYIYNILIPGDYIRGIFFNCGTNFGGFLRGRVRVRFGVYRSGRGILHRDLRGLYPLPEVAEPGILPSRGCFGSGVISSV